MATLLHQLSLDTQATLLLCGALGKEGTNSATPLTPSEYNRLAKWLLSQELRPGDLLEPSGREQLRHVDDSSLEIDRIQQLLDRGGLLAFQVEAWTNQGLWVISRSDALYPARLRERLKALAPPILYGAGNEHLLTQGGLGIVGSRNADEKALTVTSEVATRCARDGIQVISGGAKGVDLAAMQAALAAGGNVVGVLPDSLARQSVSGQLRSALREGQLALVSPYAPHAGFSVGNAMGRNKLIYTLSDWTLVVSADAGKGGTWAGATENLKHNWVPLLVRTGEGKAENGLPAGNRQLLEQGALRLDPHILDDATLTIADLFAQLQVEQARQPDSEAQPTLFEEEPEIKALITPPAPVSMSDSVQSIDNPDYFWNEIIWPHLLRLAVQSGALDKTLLHEKTGIASTQADDWLKRAVQEGKLKKQTKPVRYTITENPQLSLLNER